MSRVKKSKEKGLRVSGVQLEKLLELVEVQRCILDVLVRPVQGFRVQGFGLRIFGFGFRF